MHFTRHSTYDTSDVPIIVRGEGAYIYDAQGKRYLDGLGGLFVSQLGHGRTELADAAAAQAKELAFHPLWSYAHPNAILLAERIANYAPGDLNRVFFTTGGGEAVESAWKLAKNFFKLTGKPMKHKVISRTIAYHGTTQGALSITGLPPLKQQFEPLVPSTFRVPNTNIYRASETTGGLLDGTTRRPSAAGPPTRSPSRSRTRAPTPSPPSSSSRCRTPAAASRPRPATSSGCARSATSTTCCWSPTRSSAPSADSATCSARSATATSPTSSPAPRASPPATHRSAR